MPGPNQAAAAPLAACPSRTRVDDWRQWLLGHAAGDPNARPLASMLASQQCGRGAMPDWLGLGAAEFKALVAHHFPALPLSALQQTGCTLDPSRLDELDELVRLLLNDIARPSGNQRWLAVIVATGCMGSDHLWQDLGLWERAELSQLMERNFPAVAQRNDADMKWKRFLYKQLCETEGIYTCRSPSCEVCVDYHACFGPEN
jgi:nitrogen fixation protein NifQ